MSATSIQHDLKSEDEVEDTFESSVLGTKDFWEKAYELEIENYKDHGDCGEIWFGESVLRKVLSWIRRSPNIDVNSSLLDIGCGNGHLLVELANDGYKNLLGIDYVESAINLAKSIADEENAHISYQVADFLDDTQSIGDNSFDVCHDKGTYDAISLRPEDAIVARRNYLKMLCNICKENGLFIITSCNWTKDEIMEHFGTDFVLVETLPAPTFQFGGKVGSKVTTLVLKKQSKH